MVKLPAPILSAWQGLSAEAERYGSGLINQTFRAELTGRTVIVQRLHPTFKASVHVDIAAVTEHLASKGVTTLRLIPSDGGELWQTDEDGHVWRMLSFLDGVSYERFPSATHVREAGRMVGAFHAALSDFEHEYVHVRKGIHDLAFRERGYREAEGTHASHRLLAEVRAVFARLEPLLQQTLQLGATPSRHAHGDLKAANLLFAGEHGLALVDLDTVASMMWVFELGDALRSWCNRGAEDSSDSSFNPDTFRLALSGYASSGARVPADEVALLPRGVLTISVELALRFLTDTLEERYFGFDAARYATRGDHNLARSRAQTALALDLSSKLASLEVIAKAELHQG
jgi:Ser/Thr protein kinase RdoA (MazF antagonist)